MPVIFPDTSTMIDMGPIADGVYPAKILEVLVETSKKGNQMIVPKFDVNIGEGKTKHRKSYIVIAGEGSYNFDQLLRACHFDDLADSIKAGQKPPFDSDSLVGQECQVIIKTELVDNQTRDNISGYLKV